MIKGQNRVIFRPYKMDQPSLLPPSLNELKPTDPLVRAVIHTIDQLNVGSLLKKCKGEENHKNTKFVCSRLIELKAAIHI
jgi:hypothetical protein